MRGAIPPLPVYFFMAWTGKTSHYSNRALGIVTRLRDEKLGDRGSIPGKERRVFFPSSDRPDWLC